MENKDYDTDKLISDMKAFTKIFNKEMLPVLMKHKVEPRVGVMVMGGLALYYGKHHGFKEDDLISDFKVVSMNLAKKGEFHGFED